MPNTTRNGIMYFRIGNTEASKVRPITIHANNTNTIHIPHVTKNVPRLSLYVLSISARNKQMLM